MTKLIVELKEGAFNISVSDCLILIKEMIEAGYLGGVGTTHRWWLEHTEDEEKETIK